MLVSIASVNHNTDHKVRVIYDGANAECISKIKKLGAEVVQKEFTHKDILVDKLPWYKVYFHSGTFLIFDVPFVSKEERVLYLDCDTLVLKDPEPELKKFDPEYLVGVSHKYENEQGRKVQHSMFNSGVVYMNSKNVANFYKSNLKEAIENHNMRRQDEGLINKLFPESALLPDKLNWIPENGDVNKGTIVHYWGHNKHYLLKDNKGGWKKEYEKYLKMI